MSGKPNELTELIKSGEYYRRAHEWYRAIYIGPISERSFFLIIALMAVTVSAMGFAALMYILPITDRPAIMVTNSRIDDAVPRISRLRPERAELNESLQEFFLENYVARREGYSATQYDGNYRFIQAQSDEASFADYAARYDRNNLNSPAAILGSIGSRVVTVNAINIDTSTEPHVAWVSFSTDIVGINNGSHANWTAVLKYYYTEMMVTSVENPITHVELYETQDPQFKVVHYELKQSR